jgi:hypothetical protein
MYLSGKHNGVSALKHFERDKAVKKGKATGSNRHQEEHSSETFGWRQAYSKECSDEAPRLQA